jgi:hypothetical protein
VTAQQQRLLVSVIVTAPQTDIVWIFRCESEDCVQNVQHMRPLVCALIKSSADVVIAVITAIEAAV